MKMICRSLNVLSLLVTLLLAAVTAHAQIPPPKDASDMLSGAYTGKAYSPYAGRDFPTVPLWGD